VGEWVTTTTLSYLPNPNHVLHHVDPTWRWGDEVLEAHLHHPPHLNPLCSCISSWSMIGSSSHVQWWLLKVLCLLVCFCLVFFSDVTVLCCSILCVDRCVFVFFYVCLCCFVCLCWCTRIWTDQDQSKFSMLKAQLGFKLIV